jgi:excisionase family DNA binding protein
MPKRKHRPQPPPDLEYLTIEQTAGLTGLGAWTIRQMVKTGKLHSTRVGVRIVIRRTDVQKAFQP